MSDERRAWGLLAAYLVLMPVRWPPFPANIQLSDVVFLALAAMVIAHRAPGPGRVDGATAGPRLIAAAAALYLLGVVPSFAATPDAARSALGLAKHVYGVALYAVLVPLFLIDGFLTRTATWVALTAGAWAAITLIAAALYQAAGIELGWLGFTSPLPYVGTMFRLTGPFSSPDHFGEFLTFAFPLAIWAARFTAPTPWQRAAVVVIPLAGALTFSRSIAGLLVAGLFAVWPYWSTGPRRILRAAGAVTACALVLIVTLASTVVVRQVRLEHGSTGEMGAPYWQAFERDPGRTPLVTLAVAYNPVSYYLLKRAAIDAFLRHPVTGVGLNMFHDVTAQAVVARRLPPAYHAADPHSTWFGSLAETGLPGIVTLIALWAVMVWAGASALRSQPPTAITPVARAALAGVLGLLVNSLNVDVMHFRFLWIGLAMIGACSSPFLSPKR